MSWKLLCGAAFHVVRWKILCTVYPWADRLNEKNHCARFKYASLVYRIQCRCFANECCMTRHPRSLRTTHFASKNPRHTRTAHSPPS